MRNTRDPELDSEDDERYENEENLDVQDEEFSTQSGIRGCRGRTEAMRRSLAATPHSNIMDRMAEVIDFMTSKGLDVPTFLFYMSWNLNVDTSTPAYGKIRYARTSLMHSDLLAKILEKWYWPPRKHEEGIRTRAARQTMERWAEQNIKTRMNREMRMLLPLTSSPSEDLSEDSLLSFNLHVASSSFQAAAPLTWGLLHAAASTPLQLARNTYKNHTAVYFAIQILFSSAYEII
jgi:hypothetical protein